MAVMTAHPKADDVAQWVAEAHANGRREGVLECARWLRLKGDPKTAMALVLHIDSICGQRTEQETRRPT